MKNQPQRKSMSYSQLSEVEKIMFKSQLDSKDRLKQQSWVSYQKERKIFLDSNAWLIAVISEHIDKSYLQYLIDFQGWEAIVTHNKCIDVKKYLRSRSVAIKGQISVAIQRKTDLWNVEFGMVSNYEYSIQQFKIRLRSYLESISSTDRQYFVQNQENIQQLLFKLTHGD